MEQCRVAEAVQAAGRLAHELYDDLRGGGGEGEDEMNNIDKDATPRGRRADEAREAREGAEGLRAPG